MFDSAHAHALTHTQQIKKENHSAYGTFHIDHITSSICKMCIYIYVLFRREQKSKKKSIFKNHRNRNIVWYGLVSVVHSFLDWTVYNLFFCCCFMFLPFFLLILSFFQSFACLLACLFARLLSIFLFFTRISIFMMKKNPKSHRRISEKFFCFWTGVFIVKMLGSARKISILIEGKKRWKE